MFKRQQFDISEIDVIKSKTLKHLRVDMHENKKLQSLKEY